MTEGRVLIVDDDVNLLAGLARGLRDTFDIVTAESGVAAIAVARKAMQANKAFAVVVCDMRMPGLDGIETLESIRAESPATVPIMLTGDADRQTAVEAINRGHVFRYYTKPCPVEHLRDGLLAAIEHHRRTAAERRLLEERGRAVDAISAELEQFAHVAAHDLQEPLRSVASYVQLLQRRYGDRMGDEADELIGYAVEGTHRMKRLFQDFMTYAEIDKHGTPFQSVDLNQALAKAQGILGDVIRETGAEIIHSPLPSIMADEEQMVCLFQHLIANAVKYRKEGVAPFISVDAVETNRGETTSGWRLSVRDNGIGIDPDYHERIFALFGRLHGPDRHEGTGIGLAVCRKIVDRHGGRLWVESTLGQGATFHFTLDGPDHA